MDDLVDGDGAIAICRPCGAPHENPFATAPMLPVQSCFLCSYRPDANATSDDEWLNEDRRDAISVLHELARQAGELAVEAHVDLIYKFYSESIRVHDPELPPWCRTSIYQHLVHHVQMDEKLLVNNSLSAINAQIQSLRAVTWTEPAEPDGVPMPNPKNIALMQNLTKLMFDGIKLRKGL